ncbi:hypothetical protein HYPSUDRAFT_1044747 [Hypholoma sublateritium FD-334 SS-4]|uniref:Uncharacterized protein n=1 Tax=Hypholoma sublateritium (strain FD-334 SS-4) TaxID=945553 RepID=A0A0D2M1W7_HYPSF|nr:hypothetical protein HYPSUDRAFT_1044747 [Hypholoma sublateritium FD-334 SS-4]
MHIAPYLVDLGVRLMHAAALGPLRSLPLTPPLRLHHTPYTPAPPLYMPSPSPSPRPAPLSPLARGRRPRTHAVHLLAPMSNHMEYAEPCAHDGCLSLRAHRAGLVFPVLVRRYGVGGSGAERADIVCSARAAPRSRRGSPARPPRLSPGKNCDCPADGAPSTCASRRERARARACRRTRSASPASCARARTCSCVHASESDTLGRVVCEAMASGRAVVVRAHGGPMHSAVAGGRVRTRAAMASVWQLYCAEIKYPRNLLKSGDPTHIGSFLS